MTHGDGRRERGGGEHEHDRLERTCATRRGTDGCDRERSRDHGPDQRHLAEARPGDGADYVFAERVADTDCRRGRTLKRQLQQRDRDECERKRRECGVEAAAKRRWRRSKDDRE